MIILVIFIITLYGCIHFFEFVSYAARIAGLYSGLKVSSYSLQQITFVLTRFFFIFLMPILGLLVDLNIRKDFYLKMVYLSLGTAVFSYLVAYYFRGEIIGYFIRVLERFDKQGNIVFSMLSSVFSRSNMELEEESLTHSFKKNKSFVFLSGLVFSCYSIAVFVSYFFAIYFYDYRSFIGQLSGVINAMATLILTLYLEPKISKAVDSDETEAVILIRALLMGRFIGVFLISPILLLPLWFLV